MKIFIQKGNFKQKGTYFAGKSPFAKAVSLETYQKNPAYENKQDSKLKYIRSNGEINPVVMS